MGRRLWLLAALAAACGAASAARVDPFLKDMASMMRGDPWVHPLNPQLFRAATYGKFEAAHMKSDELPEEKRAPGSVLTPCEACVQTIHVVRVMEKMDRGTVCARVDKDHPGSYGACNMVLDALHPIREQYKQWTQVGCYEIQSTVKELRTPCPGHGVCRYVKDLGGAVFCANPNLQEDSQYEMITEV